MDDFSGAASSLSFTSIHHVWMSQGLQAPYTELPKDPPHQNNKRTWAQRALPAIAPRRKPSMSAASAAPAAGFCTLAS